MDGVNLVRATRQIKIYEGLGYRMKIMFPKDDDDEFYVSDITPISRGKDISLAAFIDEWHKTFTLDLTINTAVQIRIGEDSAKFRQCIEEAEKFVEEIKKMGDEVYARPDR